MTASPLIVGERQRADLRRLRERAVAEPVDVRAVLEQVKTADGAKRHHARMATFTIKLPTAFEVTFTIDTGHPVGTCRHLSMSSRRKGRSPTPEAVWMIAEELGFVGGIAACKVWQEEIGGGDVAINLVQPVATHDAAAS